MSHSINLWKLVTGCWPNDTLSLLNAKKHWKGKTDWFDYGSSLGNARNRRWLERQPM
jgi:hypothetical protein